MTELLSTPSVSLRTVSALIASMMAIAGCAGTGTTQRTVDIMYTFTVTDVPREAGRVLAWVPIPPSKDHQTLHRFSVESWPHRVLTDAEYGNRFLLCDLSGRQREAGEPVTVTVAFRVTRSAYRVLSAPKAEPAPLPPGRFLEPDRMVPIDGEILAEAQRVAGRAGDPLEQTRRLYDHIVTTVRYDKSGEGWGRGDARYACDVRAGNCTDFHSLFIGEARALRIPGRFIMGYSLPPDKTEGRIAGYHCWAEFFNARYGWIPIDASEASKNRRRLDELFGGLDRHRVEFTVGRDITIPEAKTGPRNYVIFPHVEIDGTVHRQVRLAVFFADV